jgi:TPR repeat protein
MDILIRAAARLMGGRAALWARYDHAVEARRRADYSEAIAIFRSLAEQGHLNSQFQLGAMHRQGHGTPENPEEAALLYRHAAERGHGRAQGALGALYAEGAGVPKDRLQAYVWYALSARNKAGWEDAELAVASLQKVMTPEELDEAERQIAEFRPKTGD